MNPPAVRWAAAAVILLAAVALIVFAVTRPEGEADDPDARAAYAEYLAVADARDRAADTARRAAEQAAAAVGTPDEVGAGAGAASAAALAREAADHAARLRAGWGDRWRRLGLAAR